MDMKFDTLLTNQSQPQIPPIQVKICNNFTSRLRGFMFRKTITVSEGLILEYTKESILDSSIHMLFMNFDLGVFWLNKDLVIVDQTLALKWKPYYASNSAAKYVLEAHPILLDRYKINDRLIIQDV